MDERFNQNIRRYKINDEKRIALTETMRNANITKNSSEECNHDQDRY